MDFIFDWVSNYGYFAIFGLLVFGIVGLPIPDETLLVFSGYLIFRGALKPIPTLLTAFLGSVCGITLSYIIGRTLGLGFVHKWGRYIHVTEERLATVHRWFDRIGHWALFVGYYIAGVRHFTAVVAGTSSLEFRSFALYAYSGGLVWVSTFLSIGFFFGDRWHEVIEAVHRNLLLVSALVIGAAIAYILIRRFRNRPGPRSQA
jgi:membrane protein DedA with SNARE-associated domain